MPARSRTSASTPGGAPGAVADGLALPVGAGHLHEPGLELGDVVAGLGARQLGFEVGAFLQQVQPRERVGPRQLLVHHGEPAGDRSAVRLPARAGALLLDGLEVEPHGPALLAAPGQGLFVFGRHGPLGPLLGSCHGAIMPVARRPRNGRGAPAPATVTGGRAGTVTTMADRDAMLHRALGLTDDEAARIAEILGRAPNHLELAMYAVMWSEHCSYKSSRLHLRRLPTEGPQVLVGPGENAGVVDVGDGIAVALRIESHNHPSAVEPYQGAATGVGGILRDIFTMGARPIALMDPLFFGPPDDARGRWLVEGVVSGISGYGNAVGVPTVGGELTFSPCYARNPARERPLPGGAAPREPRAVARRTARATWPSSSARPPGATASAA